jgi:hypothetical protein
MLAYCGDIFGEVRVERGAEPGQVHVTFDLAELVTGLEHPGGTPAQSHDRRSRCERRSGQVRANGRA